MDYREFQRIQDDYVEVSYYKKAVLSQGNRAMPLLFFSVQSSPTTFTTSLRVVKLRKPGRIGVGSLFSAENLQHLWNGETKDQVYYCWPIWSHIYALSIGAKINDFGWPWRATMHSLSKHVRISEPTTKMWMNTISDEDVAQWFSIASDNLRIFVWVPWRKGVKRQLGNRKRRFSGLSDATSSAP